MVRAFHLERQFHDRLPCRQGGLEFITFFKEFAKKVKGILLANMTEFGKSPLLSAKELEKLGIQKDQKVIDIGPYHYVRHPSYTGILLIQIGIALMFHSETKIQRRKGIILLVLVIYFL